MDMLIFYQEKNIFFVIVSKFFYLCKGNFHSLGLGGKISCSPVFKWRAHKSLEQRKISLEQAFTILQGSDTSTVDVWWRPSGTSKLRKHQRGTVSKARRGHQLQEGFVCHNWPGLTKYPGYSKEDGHSDSNIPFS